MIEQHAWPFKEAERLLKAIKGATPEKGYVLFETGYGPSGLPHIGTFGEVARTMMVKHAFETMCDIPTRLFAFSDDMDGLRKIPDNLPNHAMLKEHLGKPLTVIPDPFGTHESFGAHMNARLCAFLDQFNFEYEFKSATECYKAGMFDDALRAVLRNYQAVMDIMLPTLGKERRETYSPFLPISPKTGRVLQVVVESIDVEKGTISFRDEDDDMKEVPVTGGHCKLQWKPDWGMRWAALDVDYEMHGKDLIPSAELSTRICKTIHSKTPILLNYELFLDDKGQKISKSKGNGLSIEEWLRYAPEESLSYYMYQSPQKAKRLHFDVIPKSVDEYMMQLAKYPDQDEQKQRDNPVWHIHSGDVPVSETNLNFSLLLNLAGACNPEDPSVLWGFISRYDPKVSPKTCPLLSKLVECSMRYYEDFVKPTKKFRAPTDGERKALEEVLVRLQELPNTADAETLQNLMFEIGKQYQYENLREWFCALYEILLGQSQGPRLGSFIALFGVGETCRLIKEALARDASIV